MANNKLMFICVFTLVVKEATALNLSVPNNGDYKANERVQELKEMMLSSENLRPETLTAELNPIISVRKSLGVLIPPPIDVDDEILRNIDSQKAFACSQLQCSPEHMLTLVCACNYNTGNVVTFTNECDMTKHNCRFDTAFHNILNEVCPWEFQSRRGNTKLNINYNDAKYYN